MKNIKQKWEVFVGSVNIYVFERYKDSRGYPRERKIAKNVRGEQDAHLIASAPEMFQALQKTLSVVGHRDSGVAKKTVKELIDLIAPVLAKAEGGE